MRRDHDRIERLALAALSARLRATTSAAPGSAAAHWHDRLSALVAREAMSAADGSDPAQAWADAAGEHDPRHATFDAALRALASPETHVSPAQALIDDLRARLDAERLRLRPEAAPARVADCTEAMPPPGEGAWDVLCLVDGPGMDTTPRATLRGLKRALPRHGLLLVALPPADDALSLLLAGPHAPAGDQDIDALRVLAEDEGYGVAVFEAPGAVVMVAESDGVVWTETSSDVASTVVAASTAPAAAAADEDALVALVIETLAGIVQLPADTLSPDRAFAEFGLDSILGANLLRALERRLSLRLDADTLYEHRSAQALATHLRDAHGATLAPVAQTPADAAAPAAVPAASAPTVDEVGASVLALLAEIAQLPIDALDPDRAFADFGIDSILGQNLVRRIGLAWGVRLEATTLFECNCANAVAAHLVETYGDRLVAAGGSAETIGTVSPATPSPAPAPVASEAPAVASATISSPAPATPAAAGDDAIAVIGMSCRFARSDDPDEFWAHLAAGDDLVAPVTRWDIAALTGDTDRVWYGSLLDRIDAFDPGFFNISGREAEYMDPQQRFVLMEAWRALEDAGRAGEGLRGSACGVYLGCITGDYADQIDDSDAPPQALWGNAAAITPVRISYFLDLRGPAVAIDTSCSSALVALHFACQSLRTGEIDMALAGGVHIHSGPGFYLSTANAGMLSATGRCHTFDADADGFVPGEGVGFVVLRRERDALRDGDRIRGLIRGSGINQDGATNGITAPSREAQEALERQVYDRHGIDPATIGLVEAHGTGTVLGDPIEVKALTRAFRHYTDRTGFCALGSVKTNIGHSAVAAGIAGLIKVLRAIEHGLIPPSLHFRQANPNIDFDGSPFYVCTAPTPWPRMRDAGGHERPRRAALSSFGFSGTNAHVVVEESLAPVRQPAAREAELCVLSARTPERLREQATRLRAHLAREAVAPAAFGNLAFTLYAGRRHFQHRLACVADDLRTLAAQLDAWLRGETRPAVRAGRADVRKRPADADAVVAGDDLRARLLAAADAYVAGREPAAATLFAPGQYARLPLPTYPFARDRYWFTSTEAATPKVATPVAIASRHPFATGADAAFSGEEALLADHVVQGARVLPGVAYLELAHAAARADDDTTGTLRLRQVVWKTPLAAGTAAQAAPARTQTRFIATPDGERAFEVIGWSASGDAVSHCQGRIAPDAMPAPPALDLDAIRARCGETWSTDDVYALYTALGLDYGAAFRALQGLHAGAGEVLAELVVPDATAGWLDGCVIHPSLLDCAQQAAIALRGASGEAGRAALPFALESLRVLGPCRAKMFAWVRFAADNRSDGPVQRIDLDLCDDTGRIALRLEGFSSRVVAPAAAAPRVAEGEDRDCLLLAPTWTPQAPRTDRIDWDRHAILAIGWSQQDAERLAQALPGAIVRSVPDAGAAAFAEHAQALVALVRDLVGNGSGALRLQVVAIGDPADPAFLPARALVGTLRTVRQEHPRFVGQFVGCDRVEDVTVLAARLRADRDAPQDDVIDYRDGQRLVRGWRECDAVDAAPPWRDGGVYLITGGAGGLGLIFAEAIASACRQPRLVLVGRSEPGPAQAAAIARLRERATVDVRRCDIADAGAVQALVDDVVDVHGALHGVLHSAGVLDDAYLLKKQEASWRRVLAPKIDGLRHLDAATAALPLDAFLLFSSLSGWLGNAGQADYAAANAFLDEFAAHRNRRVARGERAGRTLSLGWPLWAEGGMRVEAATATFMRDSIGMTPMRSATGVAALARAFATGLDHVLVVEGDGARLRERLLAPSPAIATPVAEVPVTVAAAVDANTADVPDTAAVRRKLTDYLLGDIAEALKVKSEDLDPQAEFSEFGFDSISLTEFANRLNGAFELSLMPTVFFEFATAESLAGHLAQAHATAFARRFGLVRRAAPAVAPAASAVASPPVAVAVAATPPSPVPAAVSTVSSAAPTRTGRRAIAIIGMSACFPMAADIDAFWENLVGERDCIRDIPPMRWDWREHYGDPRTEPNKTNVKWGGFIDEVDAFDPLFFGISPREAVAMDPQQRLLMTHVWQALEDAGHAPSSLAGSQTGLFVGTANSGYGEMMARMRMSIEGHSSTGSVPSIGPNRMSFFLDFHGPSEPIETACSSSLVAIHRAIQAIEGGSCDMAVVGGIQTIVTPVMHISFSLAGMLCEDGRCKSFSDRANGYVRGEGVGMIVIRPLADAEADGDRILGVIVGSAENHGGRANSLTAPNPKAQAALLEHAYGTAGIDPRTVGYIEAHGTGTELGDPVEVNALKSAFAALYARAGASMPAAPHCGLGTVKSNIGHLELAAGIAGVIKVLLQLQHRTQVKSLHCDRLNPYIQLEGSPFEVVRETRAWPALHDGEGRTLPRRAGVSSFGFGGANAHVVIEEYVDTRELGLPTTGPVAIVLSARDADRLRDQASRLLEWLPRVADEDLADLAYTLQVGRDGMAHRLGMVVSSREELADVLRAFLNGEGFHGWTGVARRGGGADMLALFDGDDAFAPMITGWWNDGHLDRLVRLWVNGGAVPWHDFPRAGRPRRLRLPTYAFAPERYWVSAGPADAEIADVGAVLHPLLHRNVSTLGRTCFETRLAADHPALRDGRLPAHALPELFRTALAEGVPDATGWSLVALRWDTLPAGGAWHVALHALDDSAIGVELLDADGRVCAQAQAMPATTPLVAAAGARLRIAPDADAGPLPAALAALGLGAPRAIAGIEVRGDVHAVVAVVATTVASGIDLDLIDTDDRVLVRFHGLETEAADGGETLLLQSVWREAAPSTDVAAPDTHRVLALGDTASRLDAVLAQLPGASGRALAITPGAAGFVTLVQAVLDDVRDLAVAKAPLVQCLIPEHEDADAWQSGLGALLRSLRQELPQLCGQAIRCEATDASTIAAALRADAGDDAVEIVHADGHRRIRAVAPLAADAAPTALPWRENGRYLITGGAGALGLLLVEHLASRLDRVRLVLTGRSTLDAARAARLAALRREGVDIDYCIAAVDDLAAMTALFVRLRADGGLDGIVHAAGEVRDARLGDKTAADIARVVAPKVIGAETLDLLSADMPLDFFVCFASLSGAFGNAGQTDYAAANAWLDAFARRREAQVRAGLRSGRTRSIDWPQWREGGMRAGELHEALVRERVGLAPMATTAAWPALVQALAGDAAQVIVLSGDRGRLHRHFVEGIVTAPVADEAVARAGETTPNATPAAADAGSLRRDVEARLCGVLADVTGLDAGRIDPDEPLEHYGIDSVMIVRLNEALAAPFGRLPKTLFFQHRALSDLAGHLAGHYRAEALAWCGFAASPPAVVSVETPAHVASTSPSALVSFRTRAPRVIDAPQARTVAGRVPEPIAIVGLSGRYPGGEDLDAFWTRLAAGEDLVGEMPADRWDVDAWFTPDPDRAVEQGRYYTRDGGFLPGFADFDPLFFNIAPRDAFYMDPQERLFIESCWTTLEDAGYTRERLARVHGGRVGVFVGITKTGYELYGPGLWARGEVGHPYTSFGSVANRVSYLLDLKGPSLPVDTMCSASLTAIHEACEHLLRDECALALAGGVNLYLHPSNYVALCAQRMLSPNGRCMSFGAGGDGFVPGEGVGTVLLKRLSQAERDGDTIHAVIRATAINHGGKTNGYTVPNPAAQAALIREALSRAGIEARRVSYVEAHGTGTRLGDPIEVEGLTQAYAPDDGTQGEAGWCALGSLKSNIGHLEAAAGIAGLTKIVLQLRHGELVPTLHAETANPNIDFGRTPFVLQRTRAAWKRPRLADGREGTRIAALSSFGAGGANAHAVIEEYVMPARPPRSAPGPQAIVVSARTAPQLQAQASRLLAALDETTDFADLAYTLQVGREGLDVRAGALAETLAEARAVLASIASGESHAGVMRGQAQDRREALSRLGGADTAAQTLSAQATSGEVKELLSAWTSGIDVPWWSLPRPGGVRMLRLPGYAFARDRYWLPDMYEPEPGPGGEATSAKADVTTATAVLHPLVHANTSDFAETCFSACLRGDEPHLIRSVDASPRLSAWTALEMARIAHGFASGQAIETAVFENLVFAAPPVLDTPRTVSVGLYPHEAGTSDFELFTLGDHGDRIVHAQGALRADADSGPAPLELDGFMPERDEDDAEGLRVQHWRHPDGTTLLKLRFAGATARDDALIDAIRLEQLLRAIAGTGGSAPRLRAIARLVALAAPTRSVWVRTETTADGLTATCWNDTRQPCLQIEGLRVATNPVRTTPPHAAMPDDRGLRLLTEYQKGRLSRAEIERCIAQGLVA